MFENLISERKNRIYNIIGWCLMPITIPFFYSNFFEREHYLVRKKLLKYLKENIDNLKSKIIRTNETPIKLELNIEGCNLIYWYGERVSLHKIRTCILSDFSYGIQDAKNCKRIKNILKDLHQKVTK